ncbi:hypothetical protein B0O79_3015 [Flavobacteriaceae bacterium MAR_2009_75]|nr:hypothetical protein B0O79_3015 [Flavobacteriaceae bacterium MAR_2009_75]
MRNFRKALLILILPLFAFAAAHKFYVSVTNVNYSEKDRAIQITSRIFIDDMNRLMMARYDIDAELDTEKESKLADEYLEKYVRSKFVVSLNGQPIQYNFIGKKYDADVMICYIEVADVNLKELKSVAIENEILTDLFDDQQNVVHINIKDEKKSFVLLKSRTKGMLNL